MTAPPADSGGSSTTASWWEDFLEIFVAPSKVFTRREKGSFWIPLLVLTVLATVLFVGTQGAVQPAMDADFDRATAAAMQQNPDLQPEDLERIRSVQGRFAPLIVFFATPIGVLLTGLILWLAGKVVGAKQALGAAMMVATFAFFPRLLQLVVNGLQGLLMDESGIKGMASLNLGLARFIDPDTAGPMVQALALRADVFTLWITALLAIGLKITGKISLGNAAIAAAMVYVIGAFPTLLGALRAG